MILNKPICLLGYMGSGKSLVGKALADSMGIPFIDSDVWIEMRSGQLIPELIDNIGWEGFRGLEHDFIKHFDYTIPPIIATGGGFPLNESNLSWIKTTTLSVYLKMEEEILFQRLLKERSHRPLLFGLNPDELMEKIKEDLLLRNPVYNQADFIVDGNSSVQDLVSTLRKLIEVPSVT